MPSRSVAAAGRSRHAPSTWTRACPATRRTTVPDIPVAVSVWAAAFHDVVAPKALATGSAGSMRTPLTTTGAVCAARSVSLTIRWAGGADAAGDTGATGWMVDGTGAPCPKDGSGQASKSTNASAAGRSVIQSSGEAAMSSTNQARRGRHGPTAKRPTPLWQGAAAAGADIRGAGPDSCTLQEETQRARADRPGPLQRPALSNAGPPAAANCGVVPPSAARARGRPARTGH